jgi:hypothetical protein
MHGLSIRPFTCNWVFPKTQYAAETPRAKVGRSVFAYLDAHQRLHIRFWTTLVNRQFAQHVIFLSVQSRHGTNG